MIELNDDEKAIVMIAFGYRRYSSAILAMDNYGDIKSSNLVTQILDFWRKTDLIPDLSHKSTFGAISLSPSADDIVNTCSGLIEAFDAFRESASRSRVNLRHSIETLFELRAFARLVSLDSDKTKFSNGSEESILNTFATYFWNPTSTGLNSI